VEKKNPNGRDALPEGLTARMREKEGRRRIMLIGLVVNCSIFDGLHRHRRCSHCNPHLNTTLFARSSVCVCVCVCVCVSVRVCVRVCVCDQLAMRLRFCLHYFMALVTVVSICLLFCKVS